MGKNNIEDSIWVFDMQLTIGEWQNCTKDTTHTQVFTLTNRFEGSSSNKLGVAESFRFRHNQFSGWRSDLSCAHHHLMQKTSPFKTCGRKIHSNRNILHKQLRRGSVKHLSRTIQKTIVNNRAVKQMQSSKNSAFFTVLIMGKHFGQRILDWGSHKPLLKIHN